ncbi:MAG: type II toxin-antitoxin system HicB family antitoxin [Desulfomonile tiedjei]|nr:type II toxin-antitoxin system HicB family antitoxin [Desulfomonile tiedjei]
MAEYVALLSKDPDSDYGVDFPDFPGCVTAADSAETARELALEALCLHIEGMIEDGEPMPSPSPIEKIRSDPSNSDAIDVFLVTVPDDLMLASGQRKGKDDVFEMESCDLSWKNIDAP